MLENSGKPNRTAGIVVAVAALAILLGALGWRYLGSGSGETAAVGTAQADMSVPQSLEGLRAAASAAPDDVEAWQRLGFTYFDRGMFAEAVDAYDHATGIAPDSAVLWSSLGEARVMASQEDPMPAAALDAFRRAVAIDSSEPRARYFLAVSKDLSGDHEGAIADWLALLADTPPGAPWENDLVRTIQQVGELRGVSVEDRINTASATRNMLPVEALAPGSATAPAMPGIPGPSAEQLAAASSIPPSEQDDMAEAMVARLAARLDSDPANVDGWIMLMRSYRTLGRDQQARDALRRAVAANPAAAQQLQDAARTLGL